MKELCLFTDSRISARFEYEWHEASGQWYRTHGNEQWEIDETGLIHRRDMSANAGMVSRQVLGHDGGLGTLKDDGFYREPRSPISNARPCPKVIQSRTLFLCALYYSVAGVKLRLRHVRLSWSF
jgi:hypothetical protein